MRDLRGREGVRHLDGRGLDAAGIVMSGVECRFEVVLESVYVVLVFEMVFG